MGKSKQLATMLSDAPAALDTLDELAAALGDDANFATTVTNSIATKLPITDPAIDMGTNKKIRFTGAIGEIGSVPGFQATNDANDGLRSMGLRGTTLRFATGDDERLRIEDNAVGIGTESPSTTDSGYNKGALHVHNATGSGAQIRWTNSTTGTGTSDGFMISKWSDKNTYITNFDDGAKTIFTQSDSSGNLVSNTLVIDGDGYIGLGKGTPEYALDIEGNNFTKSSVRLTRTDSGQNNDPGIYFVNNAGANDDWGMGGIWFTNSSDSGSAYGLIRARTDDATGTSGKLEFVTGTSPVGNFTDPSMTIDSSGAISSRDENNRTATIVSPTNVVHTGAYPYHPTGDGIGNNQTNSLQMVFAHIYARQWTGGRYIHMKTNIPVTGSNYGMVVVYAKGYRYSPGGSIDSSWGFHNWGTALYSLDQRNYATTFAVNAYVSSDSYAVLVGDNQTTGTSYTGFQLSFLYSNTNYPAHTQTLNGDSHKVLAASLSSSTSGVY